MYELSFSFTCIKESLTWCTYMIHYGVSIGCESNRVAKKQNQEITSYTALSLDCNTSFVQLVSTLSFHEKKSSWITVEQMLGLTAKLKENSLLLPLK